MFSYLFRVVFGPSVDIPPAASEHDGENVEWEHQPHNRKLSGVVSKRKLQVLKAADQVAKAKYDSMDGHIRRLRGLRDQLRARKAAKRAARDATAAAPEPA